MVARHLLDELAAVLQLMAGVAGAWALGVIVLDRLGLLHSDTAAVAAPLPGPFAGQAGDGLE